MLASSTGTPDFMVDDESFEASARKPLVDAGSRCWEGGKAAGRLGYPGDGLGYLAGVVPKVDEARFARALWRAARGNTFARLGGGLVDGGSMVVGWWKPWLTG
eukprot:Skav231786  [mRNA]  locus=scaffold3283:297155:298540:+ [translate_table: standard]